MFRFSVLSVVMIFGSILVFAQPSDAGVISRNNPYRSFNTSGVNYGSMQWERKHGRQSGKSFSGWRSSNRRFRRW